MFTPSKTSTELIKNIEELQILIDYKNFELVKSLKRDTLSYIYPLKLKSRVYIKSKKTYGIIYGFEFDILNNPLFILSKINKDGSESINKFPKSFDIDDILVTF